MAAPLIAALAAPVAAEVAKEVVPIVAEEIRRMGSSFSQAPPTRAEIRIPEVPPRLPPIRIRDISEDVRAALLALEELRVELAGLLLRFAEQALKVGLEAPPREVGKRFGSDTTTLMDLALAEALHDTQTPEIQSKIRDVLDWVIKAEEKVCGSRVFVHGHESPDCRILGEVDWVLTQLHDDIRLRASPDYIAGRRLFHEGSIATDYKPKG